MDQNATKPSSGIPTAISRSLIDKSKPPQLSEGIGDVNTMSSESVNSDGAMSVDTGELSSLFSRSLWSVV